MSYFLYRKNSYFHIVSTTFSQFLSLARVFDWVPLGTIWNPYRVGPPTYEPPAWDGSYLSREHQMVMASDARNLAAALERALLHKPNNVPGAHAEKSCPAINAVQKVKTGQCELSYPVGSEHDQYDLRQFISFCRVDSFFIS